MSGIPLLVFYVYNKPSTGDFTSILNAIKASLSQALRHFFPFAGEITQSSVGEAQILCNNRGIRLIHASASISLSQLDLYHQNRTIPHLTPPFDPSYPLTVKITSYRCGGFSISWLFDHVLADAHGFIRFLSAWCEIARTKKLPTVQFNLDRQMFQPQFPPTYNPAFDKVYSVCGFHDDKIVPSYATERHLYLVRGSTVEALRSAASKGGSKRTRTEALSAYLWKLFAKTLDKCSKYNDYTKCRMGWAVDGRKRIDRDSEKIANFTGNVISTAVGEERIKDLKDASLANVAQIVSRAIDEVANREHFVDLIDWVQLHRPRKALPSIILQGSSVPAIVVSLCHNMPVMSMDFGFGLPSVGMFCSALDQLCAGYVNIVSSRKGDSWFVSAFIWPSLAVEMESDPDHVFVPVTPDHLRLG